MSFVNKSVNYSESNVLKSKYLKSILSKYNEYLYQLKLENKTDIANVMNYYIVPNNSKKYYLYIIKKNALESCKEDYDILYFFPDEQSLSFCNHKLEKYNISDFYTEIDNTFSHDYLFEGYLYIQDSKYNFLITDILAKNNTIITCDYSLRMNIINELMYKLNKNMSLYLNNHLIIGIHPVFHYDFEKMIKIFYNNFAFKEHINSVEHIHNFNKTRYINNDNIKTQDNNTPQLKRIIKQKMADIYEVFDINTGNSNGILYVKGVKDSKYLKQLFSNSRTVTDTTQFIEHLCIYNTIFKKWQHITL
jgi:uncharacterized pyridoxamine 5'-phosphate oxidase family protein